MTATVRETDTAAAPYLDAVAALLGGATPAERGELLDDLAAHLAELAAEPGPPLAERLGPPEAYASELVASAGLVPAPPAAGRALRDRVVAWWEQSRRVAAVRAFAPELLPGWWVLRAVLVAAWALVWLHDGRFGDDLGDQLQVLVLGLAGAVPSVRIGRAAVAGIAPWRDRALTAAGVVGLLVVLAAMASFPRYVFVESGSSGPRAVLVRGDGLPVTNIHAYDREGNPVEVFLYDQDGRPLDDVAEWDERTGEQIVSDIETDASGVELRHLYPREQRRLTYGPRGERWQREPSPGVVVPGTTDEPDATTTTTTQPTTPSTTAPSDGGATTTVAGPPPGG
jgi:hypothetical protein